MSPCEHTYAYDRPFCSLKRNFCETLYKRVLLCSFHWAFVNFGDGLYYRTSIQYILAVDALSNYGVVSSQGASHRPRLEAVVTRQSFHSVFFHSIDELSWLM